MMPRVAYLVALAGLTVAVSCHTHSSTIDGCELALNHSGVVECHVGPYLGPLPVEFMTVDTSKIIEIR
jgi:hypothetical protein